MRVKEDKRGKPVRVSVPVCVYDRHMCLVMGSYLMSFYRGFANIRHKNVPNLQRLVSDTYIYCSQQQVVPNFAFTIVDSLCSFIFSEFLFFFPRKRPPSYYNKNLNWFRWGGGNNWAKTLTWGTQVDIWIFVKNFQIIRSGQLAFGDQRLSETPAGHLCWPKKDFWEAATETEQRRVSKQHRVPLRGPECSHLAIHTSSSGSTPLANTKTIAQSTGIDQRLRSKPVKVLIHADADIIWFLFIFCFM